MSGMDPTTNKNHYFTRYSTHVHDQIGISIVEWFQNYRGVNIQFTRVTELKTTRKSGKVSD